MPGAACAPITASSASGRHLPAELAALLAPFAALPLAQRREALLEVAQGTGVPLEELLGQVEEAARVVSGRGSSSSRVVYEATEHAPAGGVRVRRGPSLEAQHVGTITGQRLVAVAGGGEWLKVHACMAAELRGSQGHAEFDASTEGYVALRGKAGQPLWRLAELEG